LKRADPSAASESADIDPYAVDFLMTQSWKFQVPTFFFPNFGVNSDNGKGKVKGLDKVAISKDMSISNVLLVESLNFNLLSWLNCVILDLSAYLELMV